MKNARNQNQSVAGVGGTSDFTNQRIKKRAFDEEYFREEAFRRGFDHGVHFAIVHLHNGAEIQNLETWSKILREWRMRLYRESKQSNGVGWATPPGLPVKKGGEA